MIGDRFTDPRVGDVEVFGEFTCTDGTVVQRFARVADVARAMEKDSAGADMVETWRRDVRGEPC